MHTNTHVHICLCVCVCVLYFLLRSLYHEALAIVLSVVMSWRHQGTFTKPGERGTGWKNVDGSLKQLDVGTNAVIGVNSNNQIWYRTGLSSSQQAGTAWTQVDGSLKHVSLSPRGAIWGVNSANQVWYFTSSCLSCTITVSFLLHQVEFLWVCVLPSFSPTHTHSLHFVQRRYFYPDE